MIDHTVRSINPSHRLDPDQRRDAKVGAARYRAPNVVAPNSAFWLEGCERQYCGGALTSPCSSAAACQPQRGSYSMPRASVTISALSVATMSSACFGSVIRPTAIVVTPVASLIACANGTW